MKHSGPQKRASASAASQAPNALSLPDNIAGIEAVYRALCRIGDCDSDGHLLEWREAQLRAIRASQVSDLIVKLQCLAELTGGADGLTAKGTSLAHEWVQSLLRDAVYLAGVSEGAE
ncbi:hypothetical protein [Thalassospira mesophila]|uniref:Uncharacterized protein n=1 Tax=Thalassospira mesophila TaxID=1293891 RepID=A0A1Y2L343_9PROT|nr:hypothetical protein [Thalassospira mesophila]OSQ39002.1 hypothetical protein TMES_09920 [Thalassospira mesophila]